MLDSTRRNSTAKAAALGAGLAVGLYAVYAVWAWLRPEDEEGRFMILTGIATVAGLPTSILIEVAGRWAQQVLGLIFVTSFGRALISIPINFFLVGLLLELRSARRR